MMTKTEITIEKNIVIPPRKHKVFNPNSKHSILKRMIFGDSIEVTKKSIGGWRAISSQTNIKILTRKISEDKFRVWKIENPTSWTGKL